jgi:hypothetical protein
MDANPAAAARRGFAAFLPFPMHLNRWYAKRCDPTCSLHAGHIVVAEDVGCDESGLLGDSIGAAPLDCTGCVFVFPFPDDKFPLCDGGFDPFAWKEEAINCHEC